MDGLKALDYPVVLANPARIEQYNGLKHADDANDAFFLAELLRLDLRPVRDLLRRRTMTDGA